MGPTRECDFLRQITAPLQPFHSLTLQLAWRLIPSRCGTAPRLPRVLSKPLPSMHGFSPLSPRCIVVNLPSWFISKRAVNLWLHGLAGETRHASHPVPHGFLGLPGTHPVAYDEQARPPPHPIMPFFGVQAPSQQGSRPWTGSYSVAHLGTDNSTINSPPQL